MVHLMNLKAFCIVFDSQHRRSATFKNMTQTTTLFCNTLGLMLFSLIFLLTFSVFCCLSLDFCDHVTGWRAAGCVSVIFLTVLRCRIIAGFVKYSMFFDSTLLLIISTGPVLIGMSSVSVKTSFLSLLFFLTHWNWAILLRYFVNENNSSCTWS